MNRTILDEKLVVTNIPKIKHEILKENGSELNGFIENKTIHTLGIFMASAQEASAYLR